MQVGTARVVALLASKIVPIVLTSLGLVILAQSNRRVPGKTLGRPAIATIGLVFLAAAATLLLAGRSDRLDHS